MSNHYGNAIGHYGDPGAYVSSVYQDLSPVPLEGPGYEAKLHSDWSLQDPVCIHVTLCTQRYTKMKGIIRQWLARRTLSHASRSDSARLASGRAQYTESRYVQTYSLVFNHRVFPNLPRRIKFNHFRMEFHALALECTLIVYVQ